MLGRGDGFAIMLPRKKEETGEIFSHKEQEKQESFFQPQRAGGTGEFFSHKEQEEQESFFSHKGQEEQERLEAKTPVSPVLHAKEKLGTDPLWLLATKGRRNRRVF